MPANEIVDDDIAGLRDLEDNLAETLADEIIDMKAPGYEPLARILRAAFCQSSNGKGRERHGNGKPFAKQPIMEIGRMVGVGGHTFQISKKAQEATTMVSRDKHDEAITELYGVIVYAAAAVLLIEEAKGLQSPGTFA